MKNNHILRLLACATLTATAITAPRNAAAIDILSPATHCDKDTSEITAILRTISQTDISEGERRIAAAKMLTGRAKDTNPETDSTGTFRLNIHTFTPISFINTVQAIAKASANPAGSWQDFAHEYEKISCRRGEEAGFASVLWHGGDWIADNVYRGNIKELTENFEGIVSKTKSLDYMSRNRDKFAALSNPEIFDKIEMIEMGYKQHRIPYLKRQFISRSDVEEALCPGDIIMLLSNADGEDIYRIGYVDIRNGKKYLIGYNPNSETIESDKESLDRIFKTFAKYFFGFRILRWQ